MKNGFALCSSNKNPNEWKHLIVTVTSNIPFNLLRSITMAVLTPPSGTNYFIEIKCILTHLI